jgi:hypothetical protein
VEALPDAVMKQAHLRAPAADGVGRLSLLAAKYARRCQRLPRSF